MTIIESGCRCGQRILIETNSGASTCNVDGVRPHHPGDAENVTAFRCRTCAGWLDDTCNDLAAIRQLAQNGEGTAP